MGREGQNKAAGFVIFRRHGENKEISFLMLQSSKNNLNWTPPKGHVERGELDMEAAYRETEEEAGLTEKQFRVYPNFLAVLEYSFKGKPKTVVYWLAELNDSNAKVRLSHEHIDYKWLSCEEACTKSGYADMQKVLRNSVTFIESLGDEG